MWRSAIAGLLLASGCTGTPGAGDAGSQRHDSRPGSGEVDGGHGGPFDGGDAGVVLDGGVFDGGDGEMVSDGGVDVEILCPDRPDCRIGDAGALSSLWEGPLNQQESEFQAAYLSDGSAFVSGVYLGATNVFGTNVPDYSGVNVFNAYVARISPAGEMLWVASFGMSGRSAIPRRIAIDEHQTAYVVVTAYGRDDKIVRVVPISSDGGLGNPLDVARGPEGNGTELLVDSEGLFIAGEYTGEWSVGGVSLPTTDNSQWNAYLVRVGRNGLVQWSTVIDCDSDDWAPMKLKGMARWGVNEVAVSHSFWPEVIDAFDVNSGVATRSVILGEAGDHPHGAEIASGRDGNLLVAASFSTLGARAPTGLDGEQFHSGTDSDIYLASLAPDGRPLWQRGLHGNGPEWPRAMAQLASGDILVAGLFDGTDADFGLGSVAGDSSYETAFVARFSEAGDPVGALSFGGRWIGTQTADWARNGYVIPDGIGDSPGGPIVWGWYQGEANPGFGAEDSHQGVSSYLLRFAP